MEFSGQEYWSGLPCPSPGNLPNPGIKAESLMSPALAGGFFITSATREAGKYTRKMHKHYHPAQPIDPTSDITDLSYSPHISSSIVFPDLYTPTLKDSNLEKVNFGEHLIYEVGFPGGTSDKEPICQCRRHKKCGFSLWVGKIPWRRAWQPTPVFLPGESHG